MLRILQCPIGNMNVGGIENMLMQIYRNIDRTKIQFDFVVHDENENFYEAEILKLGGIVYKIPYISKEPVRHLKEFENLLREHSEYKIVHFHTTYAIMYYDAKLAKRLGRTVVVHSHNSNARRMHRCVHMMLKKKFSRLADYRLSCSYIAGEWMFSDTEKYDIWKNAIALEKFRFAEDVRKKLRKELGISEADILIGNVARLSYQKNQSLLIDVYRQYRRKHSNSRLLLVGSGEDEELLKEKVAKISVEDTGFSDSVIFTGNKSNANDYMMAIDIFCLTSRWEGFGISMIEALTAGEVVVAPVLVDRMIREFENVYIVENYEDVSEWVKILESTEVLNDSERAMCYGKMANRGYDIKDQVKTVERFYMEIEYEYKI